MRAAGGRANPFGHFRATDYAPYSAPHQKGFADGGFANRIEAANQPSTNVEDAGAASAQDLLFGAMRAFGVDPLRMSRFVDQPPATTPMAQSAQNYINLQNPAWWRRTASHLGYDPAEVAPRATGGKVMNLRRKTASNAEMHRLIEKVEREMPLASASAQISRLCSISPDFQQYLKGALGRECSRSGALAMLKGYLRRTLGLVKDGEPVTYDS
jgi:hypothetical protein